MWPNLITIYIKTTTIYGGSFRQYFSAPGSERERSFIVKIAHPIGRNRNVVFDGDITNRRVSITVSENRATLHAVKFRHCFLNRFSPKDYLYRSAYPDYYGRTHIRITRLKRCVLKMYAERTCWRCKFKKCAEKQLKTRSSNPWFCKIPPRVARRSRLRFRWPTFW